MTDRLVHPGVPDELWLAVFVGALDEHEAIARGLLAAAATSEEERRKILFNLASPTERPPTPLPTGPMPWFEP